MGFRSGLEEQVAESLDTLGVIYEYESTRIPYTLQCNYNPDFILANGVHLEAKGYFTGKDRRKILAVLKDNPDLDLRMVFQKPYQKITRFPKQPMQCGATNTTSNGVPTTTSQLNG